MFGFLAIGVDTLTDTNILVLQTRYQTKMRTFLPFSTIVHSSDTKEIVNFWYAEQDTEPNWLFD